MTQEDKIKELNKKVQELEILRDKCSLTNDIKISLVKYIESNEELKKGLKQLSEKSNTYCDNRWCCFIEMKWVFLFIIIAIIIAIKV